MATRPRDAELSAKEIDSICRFLESAPPEVQPWAISELERLRSGISEDVAPRDASDFPCVNGNASDDNVAHTDALSSPGKSASGKPGEASIVTPSDKPENTLPPVSPNRQRKIVVTTIVIAAVVAVFFGVYWLGKPQDPHDPMAQAPHGDMSQMMGGTGEGGMSAQERAHRISELHAILKKNPDDVKAHLELGVLVFDQKDTESAKEHWEAVTRLDPNEVAAWYNLGFLYQSENPPHPDKAKAAWDKVVELAPDSDLARVVTMHSKALDGSGPGATPPLSGSHAPGSPAEQDSTSRATPPGKGMNSPDELPAKKDIDIDK